MRKGKMVAQGAHASMKATLENLDDPRVKQWLNGAFTKICVSVDTQNELFTLEEQCKDAGLITALICDNGATEFGGVSTFTALAIGPDLPETLAPFTSHLKLL